MIPSVLKPLLMSRAAVFLFSVLEPRRMTLPVKMLNVDPTLSVRERFSETRTPSVFAEKGSLETRTVIRDVHSQQTWTNLTMFQKDLVSHRTLHISRDKPGLMDATTSAPATTEKYRVNPGARSSQTMLMSLVN